ncbi:MAG TPA: CAP domain-containing protein [Ktedonobacterales bacterium]|jgi:uncharacterized protein YkwD
MARRLTHRLSTLGTLALGGLLLAQLAACGGGGGGAASAAHPLVGQGASQIHVYPVVSATATATATPDSLAGSLQAAAATVTIAQDGPLTFNADYVNAVIAITNQERAANGCEPLTANPILMGTAQAHSNDMALHHYFSHVSSTGLTPPQRIAAAGYAYSLAAENIAAGYATPQDVMSTWFNETPPNDAHRRNILDCRLRDIGVGYCYLANDPNAIPYHSYWTEDFGTPA